MSNSSTLNYLNTLLQDRFSAEMAINGVVNKIKAHIEDKIMTTYKDKRVKHEDLEFTLIGVSANYYNWSTSFEFNEKIEVNLHYICVSKLPSAAKRKKVLDALSEYNKIKRLPWSNFKTPLWRTLTWNLNIESCLKPEDIRLGIIF